MTSRRSEGTKDIVVRLPVDLHAAVKDRAAAEERSVAATIRIALRQYLDTDPGRDEGAP